MKWRWVEKGRGREYDGFLLRMEEEPKIRRGKRRKGAETKRGQRRGMNRRE